MLEECHRWALARGLSVSAVMVHFVVETLSTDCRDTDKLPCRTCRSIEAELRCKGLANSPISRRRLHKSCRAQPRSEKIAVGNTGFIAYLNFFLKKISARKAGFLAITGFLTMNPVFLTVTPSNRSSSSDLCKRRPINLAKLASF